MVKSCRWCKAPLRGNATMYCTGPGTSCKQRSHAFQQSMDRLAELPEPEMREALRGVFVKRWGLYGKTRRFHLRFGEYQESRGRNPDQLAYDVSIVRDATPGIRRVAHGVSEHWFVPRHTNVEGWGPRALRVIARILERRTRKAREARHA